MSPRRFACLAPLALAWGCSQGGGTSTDGGPPLAGRRSFEVTATLTVQTDGGARPTGAPTSHKFTLVIGADRGLAIVGSDGSATSLPAQEIPLPSDATSEIVIARIARGMVCPGFPPPPLEGVIIDDLRVE